MSRQVWVAADGTVPRKDRCQKCGDPMFYKVDSRDRIVSSFCANLYDCPAALDEIKEPEPR